MNKIRENVAACLELLDNILLGKERGQDRVALYELSLKLRQIQTMLQEMSDELKPKPPPDSHCICGAPDIHPECVDAYNNSVVGNAVAAGIRRDKS